MQLGVEREFHVYFVNQTKSSVEIERLESQCGCVAGFYEGQSVEDGETLEIRLRVLQSKAGKFEKAVRIDFVDRSEHLQLLVSGHAEPYFKLSPGIIEADEKGSHEAIVHLTSAFVGELEDATIECQEPFLKFEKASRITSGGDEANAFQTFVAHLELPIDLLKGSDFSVPVVVKCRDVAFAGQFVIRPPGEVILRPTKFSLIEGKASYTLMLIGNLSRFSFSDGDIAILRAATGDENTSVPGSIVTVSDRFVKVEFNASDLQRMFLDGHENLSLLISENVFGSVSLVSDFKD